VAVLASSSIYSHSIRSYPDNITNSFFPFLSYSSFSSPSSHLPSPKKNNTHTHTHTQPMHGQPEWRPPLFPWPPNHRNRRMKGSIATVAVLLLPRPTVFTLVAAMTDDRWHQGMVWCQRRHPAWSCTLCRALGSLDSVVVATIRR